MGVARGTTPGALCEILQISTREDVPCHGKRGSDSLSCAGPTTRPAGEAVDLLAQRVKAFELQASGIHFTVAQQQELLLRETASIATTPELWGSAKREEGRVRAEAARPYGVRGSASSKPEEWSKGWTKKGSNKGKGQKGEPKKSEGDKPDKEKTTGS